MRGDRRDGGFWWTNHVANPPLRRLLRGPLGARLGARLAMIRYRGRRTRTAVAVTGREESFGDVMVCVDLAPAAETTGSRVRLPEGEVSP